MSSTLDSLLDSSDSTLWEVATNGAGPVGSLPLTEDLLLNSPSGDLFGLTQNAGMGWNPTQLLRKQFLILSTQGGIRGEDGKPIALGYHTGHYEVGLLMRAAAEELDRLEALPFAAYVSDPCDGRTQGTVGMMDSLAYRNDAAVVLKRLIRSLPTRRGVIGVATCDKGLPAMMLALAAQSTLPCVIVPGGVTLPPAQGEDAGKVQTIGARFAHGEITLEEAAEAGCRACGSPGGGCQFLGTAATAQVVAEAFGMALPHSALSPSGQPIWLDIARRSARAVFEMEQRKQTIRDILTPDALHNAMVVHAACGGSTNLLLHIPAVAFEAGLTRPTVDDWSRINRQVPRLVDCLPNGPVGHPTVRFFLAGGVPELMLHLRTLGLLKLDALTVAGRSLGDVLEWWERSERRQRLREVLVKRDGVDPDTVIMSPTAARDRGLTSTVTFPIGNIAPEGSVIKSTAIDKSVVDADGVYRKTGPARVFTSERAAIAAVKGRPLRGAPTEPDGYSPNLSPIKEGDVIVLMCRGPLGCGMEETYQITSALRYLPFGKHVALITDARFSGVSTGACIGHIGPEALDGGPIGKLRDGDLIQIEIDTRNLTGSLDFVGTPEQRVTPEEGAKILAERTPAVPLHCDPNLPPETRLWALLQRAGGGTWAGCVYDVDKIAAALEAGLAPRSGG
ncbi:YjhG/YagF family D-xylonate dehydratase [Schlesneria paludicola]|uniref:YjhG/YagF family D-xylonate dehydratase n=1 Tax=Schlesneria paludicola TaxID=360056 RepID=UPI00029A6176|nr:YjhG/YagF family D-xylonate dehydratase [Schlesneria paludicola]